MNIYVRSFDYSNGWVENIILKFRDGKIKNETFLWKMDDGLKGSKIKLLEG